MATKTFWISYDLGIKGDYTGLYTWLDNNKAQECGDSIAVFKKNTTGTDPLQSILTEIKKNVKLGKHDRIYIIYKKDDGLVKGKFIIGGRKRSPWDGYGVANQVAEDF